MRCLLPAVLASAGLLLSALPALGQSEPSSSAQVGEAVPAESPPPVVVEQAPAPAIVVRPRVPEHWDASVFAEPIYSAPLVGHVARDAILPIRGVVRLPGARFCQSEVYFALHPYGYLCGDDGELSHATLTTQPAMAPMPESVVPYRYAMVNVEEGEYVPLFGGEADVVDYANPKRMLGRGDTLAVEEDTMSIEGVRYRVTLEGDLVAAEQTYLMRRFSDFAGVQLPQPFVPFGWVKRRVAPVLDAPKGTRIGERTRRERVEILGEVQEGRRRYLKIGEGEYMRADFVNEVRLIERPEGTGHHPQWIDVDLGEQVVVAYRGATPEYATMISSGRPPNNTPRGNYPIWGKASAITMRSQAYDDHPYMVQRVPWVLFFQAHNALHGAYWHDGFGAVRSHGCANLAPRDAQALFEWVEPKLQPGWTAVRFADLSLSPVVHVRNSAMRHPFKQEREIGPPDPEREAERLRLAEERRAQEALEAAQQAAADGQPLSPGGVVPGSLPPDTLQQGSTTSQTATP